MLYEVHIRSDIKELNDSLRALVPGGSNLSFAEFRDTLLGCEVVGEEKSSPYQILEIVKEQNEFLVYLVATVPESEGLVCAEFATILQFVTLRGYTSCEISIFDEKKECVFDKRIQQWSDFKYEIVKMVATNSVGKAKQSMREGSYTIQLCDFDDVRTRRLNFLLKAFKQGAAVSLSAIVAALLGFAPTCEESVQADAASYVNGVFTFTFYWGIDYTVIIKRLTIIMHAFGCNTGMIVSIPEACDTVERRCVCFEFTDQGVSKKLLFTHDWKGVN